METIVSHQVVFEQNIYIFPKMFGPFGHSSA